MIYLLVQRVLYVHVLPDWGVPIQRRTYCRRILNASTEWSSFTRAFKQKKQQKHQLLPLPTWVMIWYNYIIQYTINSIKYGQLLYTYIYIKEYNVIEKFTNLKRLGHSNKGITQSLKSPFGSLAPIGTPCWVIDP